MDIVSSASAAVGLVFNFATAAKTCKAVRGRYKDAALTIDSIRQELETLQAALQQLANLMMHNASALTSQWDTDQSLSGTFTRSIKSFERTIRGLQSELDRLKLEKQELGRLDKAKVVWNEDGMREHLGRLRSQVGALQLHFTSSRLSEVKQHVKNLESALLQVSVASIGDESDGGEQKPSREQTIQHDQGDLLDLTWSEKNSEVGTTKKMLQKSYPGLIPTALDTNYDTSDTDSISSSNSYPDSTERLDLAREITHDPTVQRFQQEQNDGTINKTDTVSSQPMANEEPSQECQSPASLIEAVIKWDAIAVTILLQSGFDVDTMEKENKRTGLMLAALLDHYRVLKVLLNKGANISAQDRAGRTALHFSAAEGYYECTELLLSYGAPVNKYDTFHEVPLHRAVRYSKPNIVKLLLPYYPDLMVFLDGQKRNILHLAVRYGTLNMVEIVCNHLRLVQHHKNCLIENQEDDVSDRRCLCPATCQHFRDVNVRGHTAFHNGLINGHQDVVALLLHCMPSFVEDPLRLASEDLTPQLLLEGKPLRWRRPLHHALLSKLGTHRYGMYKILVEGGANVNSKDSDGRTPLMLAKSRDDTEATAFLLAHGAKPSSSSPSKQDGNTQKTPHRRRRKATLQDRPSQA